MHVFFITQWFPTLQQPFNGIFVLEHARAVARTHTVTLLHIHGVDPTLKRTIQVTQGTDASGFIVYELSYLHPRTPFTTWIRRINAARQAFKMASDQYGRPDIIHANIWNTADVAVLLGKLAGIPVVLSEHSSSYARRQLTPWQIRKMRFFMNRVDVIMPVCDALGTNIRDYGIHQPMLSVQNVADTEIFHPASAGEQVSSPYRELAVIARLSEEKAVHLAIQAAARLQQQGIFFQLHIAGDGPERAHLEHLVVETGISEWVHFYGYLPKLELAKLLRRSSAFLLTSLWESQPVVILEALSCGLPVVAPTIGGIPEIITPECGLLFQTGNIEDLVSKLSILILNLPRYDAQCIHQYALEHFSPIVVGNRLDSIYRLVINRPGRHDYASGN